jgi:hypothetical protein
MVRESGTRFGIYFLVALGVLLSASDAHANDIYVAQNSTGAGNGAGCADARPVAWFNNSTSWGEPQCIFATRLQELRVPQC